TTAVSYKGMDNDSDGGVSKVAGAFNAAGLGGSEDESSEDEDFVAGSESDVPEEFDDKYESSVGSDAE
ncbi:hypothetical protein GGI22_006023, partial [Coemansia erecta]